MIVEFLGVSGVGKSTIAEEYYRQAIENSRTITWPRYRLYMKTGWLKRNIIKSVSVIHEALRDVRWVHSVKRLFFELGIHGKNRYVLLFNFLSYKSLFSKCTDCNCEYLFDEGVFQLIWATWLRAEIELRPEHITKILQMFQVPDRLIIVEADTPIIMERLWRRGTRTKILESSNLEASINLMKKRQAIVIQTAIETGLIHKSAVEYYFNNQER